ncbi:DNA repair protein RadC [soil metagenome]
MRPLPSSTTASSHQGSMSLFDTSSGLQQEMDDATLLSLLMTRTLPEHEIKQAVEALLEAFGSVAAVVAADPPELARVARLGGTTITDLKMLRRLSVRLARSEACRRPVLSSWSALVAYLRSALAHEPREQFRTLYLDKKNILLRDEFLADGTVDHAPVYPREVIRRALELSASAIILVHNHPSGDPAPSRADIEMTRQIVDAARVFGLQVHDHLVIGRHGTASFKQLGLI